MRLVTVSGPSNSGKTSVIVNIIRELRAIGRTAGVLKFDCLTTDDDKPYKKHDIPIQVGLSGGLCPDHFFGSNISACIDWGKELGLDILISESAGLCNRCSPHIKDMYAICVIDNLMGANAPRKIGPMLKMADAVIVTKADIVSQAEREVFAFHIRLANAKAVIMPTNGLTGQGCGEMARIIERDAKALDEALALRFPMPAALCSYCLGETQIQPDLLFGNQRRMQIR